MVRGRERFACALEALDARDFAGAEQALAALLAAEAAPADRAFLYNKRGVARIGLGRAGEACQDFDAALAAQPGYAPALTNLGNVLVERGELDDAIRLYERAIASDPRYALAHLNLGVAYKRAGRVAEGVRALREAQRLERLPSPAGFWRRARRR